MIHIKVIILALSIVSAVLPAKVYAQVDSLSMLRYDVLNIQHAEYNHLQTSLAIGWNTWNNHSMLSQVLLPHGFSISLGLKDRRLFGEHVREFYPMENEMPGVVIRPGKVRSFDGKYTDVEIEWKGIHFRVESAANGDDVVWLISPIALPKIRPHITIEAGMLWRREGRVVYGKDELIAECQGRKLEVGITAPVVKDLLVSLTTPYLVFQMNNEQVGVYVGKRRSLAEIKELVNMNRAIVDREGSSFGNLKSSFQASQAILGWSTIYEPMYDRVVTPGAGRWWNKRFNDYVLWGWDFTAFNFLPFDRKMAYANLVEIIRHKTPEGFLPNYAMGYGIASRDRSQPPVYSWAAKEIFLRYKEKWFLDILFPHLLDNNRWWHNNRSYQGYLCWGSSPVLMDWDAHTKKAAMFESGLDNSPMFDEAVFDSSRHIILQGDVGLMSLYILDCESLASIADWLGKIETKAELLNRAAGYRQKLALMWDEKTGLYLNRRLDSNTFNPRISPTNFYPLLIQLPNKERARRMVNEHLLNPAEFYGQWMLPSVPRNDPAYKDQSYWRGRIWPPLNMFVYMGLKNYGFDMAAKELAENSNNLMLKGYLKGNWIRENFHADHGDGTPCTNRCFGGSDCYYTWGSLMAIPMLMENGVFQKK